MSDSKEGKPNPYMSQLSLFASPEMSVLSTDEVLAWPLMAKSIAYSLSRPRLPLALVA
jgi:hypothetical protein